jgi:CYTH domain-containing protein
MSVETERKFLVTGEFKSHAVRQVRISQGYLSSVPGRTVRVRSAGAEAFLTIKGQPDDTGTSRYEWEISIPATTAEELFELCEPGRIDKTRYLVPFAGFTWEVDEFYGENEGLILAEIELPTIETVFEKPGWIGREVTGDQRYYNSMLAKKPFSKWYGDFKDSLIFKISQ